MRRNSSSPSTLTISSQETCCQCGMSRREWVGAGFKKEGFMYCCERCAQDTGCSCYEVARLAPREKRKAKASARVVTPKGGWRP